MICASPRRRLPLIDVSVIGITMAPMTPMMPTAIINSMSEYPRSDLMAWCCCKRNASPTIR